MSASDWGALLGGIALVAATFSSLVVTLVVPRALPSRLVSLVGSVVGLALGLLARPLRSFEAKDRVYALHGPLWIIADLAVWLTTLFVGFGLMVWAISEQDLWGGLREAGSSMLTLGFSSTVSVGATGVDFAAAATGLIVIALQIAYLPVLYTAFTRRETMVTTLESRAGMPAWGPEILWRHHRVGIMDNLPDLYAQWEHWAAEVAESHATYPVLIHFRSPHPLRSWVTGLLAVLDSAAMYQALCPERAPSEARLCLRMGFSCLRQIADALRLDYDPDPSPDEAIALTPEEFADGVALLTAAGFPVERSAEEAWPHFRGWRVNYEPLAYAIADRVVAAPGPWSGPRRALPGLVIEPRRPVDRRPTT